MVSELLLCVLNIAGFWKRGILVFGYSERCLVEPNWCILGLLMGGIYDWVRHQFEKPLKIRQTKTKTTQQQQQQTKQRGKEYKCQHTLNSRSS